MNMRMEPIEKPAGETIMETRGDWRNVVRYVGTHLPVESVGTFGYYGARGYSRSAAAAFC